MVVTVVVVVAVVDRGGSLHGRCSAMGKISDSSSENSSGSGSGRGGVG